MPQLTIYLDEETARRLDEAARRERVSRSALVKELVTARIGGAHDPRIAALHRLFGAWRDERTAEEIIADIDDYSGVSTVEPCQEGGPDATADHLH